MCFDHCIFGIRGVFFGGVFEKKLSVFFVGFTFATMILVLTLRL